MLLTIIDIDRTATFSLCLGFDCIWRKEDIFRIFLRNDMLHFMIHLHLLHQKPRTKYPIFYFAMFLQSVYPELKASLLIEYSCIDGLQKLLYLWSAVVSPCPEWGSSHSQQLPLYNAVHLLPVVLQQRKLIYKYRRIRNHSVIFRGVHNEKSMSYWI